MSDSLIETTEGTEGAADETRHRDTDSAAAVRKLTTTTEEQTQDLYLKYFGELIGYLVAEGTNLLMIQALHRQPEELSLRTSQYKRRRLIDATVAQLRHDNRLRDQDNAIKTITTAIDGLKDVDIAELTWAALVGKRSLLLALRPYFVGVPLAPSPYVRYNGMLTAATAKDIRRGRVPRWLTDPWAALSSHAGLPDF